MFLGRLPLHVFLLLLSTCKAQGALDELVTSLDPRYHTPHPCGRPSASLRGRQPPREKHIT